MAYKDYEKAKENTKKWQKNNPEKVKEYREKSRIKKRETDRKYREKNKEKIREYREKNKERRSEGYKKWYVLNKERRSEVSKKWREDNKEHIKKYTINYHNNRRKVDPIFRLRKTISDRISLAIRKGGYTKTSKTEVILGINYVLFIKYLESLWEPWMSWDNYGKYKKNTFNYGWDIDHIIPGSTATTKEEILKLNHYTNLKPLCSKVNRDIKKDKV